MNDDRFDELLANYDESLAKGSSDCEPISGDDDVLRQRLLDGRVCLDLLESVFPRHPVSAVDELAGVLALAALFPLPRVIGRFEIRRELGRGGHGIVYLAYDTVLKREVALKVPRPEVLQSSEIRLRFRREAEAAARLEHPNLIRLYETGEIGPVTYLVSEFCSGPNLATWLKSQKVPVTSKAAVQLVLPLAEAVGYMHSQGVLHRDIKPGNVILQFSIVHDAGFTEMEFPEAEFAVPKITDFGLAHFVEEATFRTRTGALVGTPAYMSPEQAQGRQKDVVPSTDVYSLGVILYTLLIGQPPFVGATDLETLHRIVANDVVLPRRLRTDISRDLETVILKCLEKSPQHRYASAALMAQDLNSLLSGNPIQARRQHFAHTAWRWMHKHPLPTTVTLFVILLGAMVVDTGWLKDRMNGSRIVEMTNQPFKSQQPHLVDVATPERKKNGEHEAIEKAKAELKHHEEEIRLRNMYSEGIQEIAKQSTQQGYTAVQKLRELIPRRGGVNELGFEWYYLLQLHGGDVVPLKLIRTDSPIEIDQIHISGDGQSLGVATNGKLDEYDLPSGKFRRRIEDSNGKRIQDFIWTNTSEEVAVVLGRSPHIHFLNTGLMKDEVSKESTTDGRPNCSYHQLAGSSHLKEIISVRGVNENFNNAPKFGSQPRQTSPFKSIIWRHDISTGQASKVTTLEVFDFRALVIDPSDSSLVYATAEAIHVNRDNLERQVLPLTDDWLLQSLAISQDGTLLAASTILNEIILCRKTVVGEWKRAETLSAVKPLADIPRIGRSNLLNPVCISPRGDEIYWAHNLEVHLTDIARLQVTNSISGLPGAEVRHLEVTPDGRTAVWSTDKAFGLWRPVAGIAPIAGHTQNVWTLAYSPDGTTLATGSTDQTLKLWNTTTGRTIVEESRHRTPVSMVAFSPDGKLLASGGLDGAVCVWDLPAWKYRFVIPRHLGQPQALAWFGDSRRLVIGDSSGSNRQRPNRVLIWDVIAQRELKCYTDLPENIRIFVVTDDQQVIGFSNDQQIRIWNTETDTCRTIPIGDINVRSAVLLKQNAHLAIGGAKGEIQIRETATGKMIYEFYGHTDTVLTMAVSPDGRTLASGSTDQTVRLWDAKTGHQLLTLEQSVPIHCIAFAPNGETLAVALHDGSIKQYHAPKITPIRVEGSDFISP